MIYKMLFIAYGVMTLNLTQNDFKRFVESFREEKSTEILNFGHIVERNNKMTKSEATTFVYHGDTTKLYCTEITFNMETEEVEGVTTELRLPCKCLLIKMKNYMIIGYTSNQCIMNEPFNILLHLSIVDNSFHIRDSLVAYRGAYDFDISGLINPKNGKIFLVKYDNMDKIGYLINTKNMKFEVSKQNIVKGNTDYLIKVLETIKWKEEFNN